MRNLRFGLILHRARAQLDDSASFSHTKLMNLYRHTSSFWGETAKEERKSTYLGKEDLFGKVKEFPLSYPDFLLSPVLNRREKLYEDVIHADMLERRMVIEIPEFYIGTVMAVTCSDPNMGTRQRRFVGICISRNRMGLHHQFTLRNVVDGLGIEIMYDLYNPTIQKIEVLKLEKRLDQDLSYLADALPEYSTFPFDMEPIPHPIGKPVPMNPIKVKMRPPPWSCRWSLYDIKGIDDSWTHTTPYYKKKMAHKSKIDDFNKYDIVQHYRDQSQEFEHDIEVQEKMVKFEKARQETDSPRRILRSVEAERLYHRSREEDEE
ncbi:ribosomal protein l19 domain-containing protein [Ditylenchus destructor]|uniref:Large ribosomal subunit protein bL19m n=1 Tax=Ditylenchus destructor TaxID=166010 RepID=A0AAD4RD87_9BILA|nr:ribosomal protein l19 domain-containing protein [Ditylenchus destructor]